MMIRLPQGWRWAAILLCVTFLFVSAPVIFAADAPLTFLSSIQGKDSAWTRYSPELKKQLESGAAAWVRAMDSRGRFAKNSLYRTACEQESRLSDPFCQWMDQGPAGGSGQAPKPSKTGRRLPLKKLVQAVHLAKLDVLASVREGDLRKALGQFEGAEGLKPLITQLLDPASCPPPSLLMNSGLKMEEYFPDSEHLKTAAKLYERAVSCHAQMFPQGKPVGDTLPEKARYRAALIHTWSGDCASAQPFWDGLARDVEGDYTTRSFYWSARCAEKLGKADVSSEYRSRLFKMNPISYHAYVLNGRKELPEWTEFRTSTRDPELKWESVTKPELTGAARALEALLAAGERSAALRLLRKVETRGVQGSEPEFKLYLASLAGRLNDSILQFRLLDAAFRTDTQLITQATLKYFFPLKRFDQIESHRDLVDPFLVSALIRQESGFNENARSQVGAVGLMQLMPATARTMGRVTKKQLYKPDVNIKLGVRYFRSLIERFDGDTDLALAAYNAGPLKVDEWRRRYPVEDRVLFVDLMPFGETRKYVALISRNYFWYLKLYQSPAGEGSTKDVNVSVPTEPKKETFLRLRNQESQS